jgi:hypothetical protein
VPRFLHSFDETLDGALILPRGLRDTVTAPAEQAGRRLEITDDRARGTTQDFTFTATLSAAHQEAASEPARHDLAMLVSRARPRTAPAALVDSERPAAFSPRPRRESCAKILPWRNLTN